MPGALSIIMYVIAGGLIVKKLTKPRNYYLNTFFETIKNCGCVDCTSMVYCICGEKDYYAKLNNVTKPDELRADYKAEAVESQKM